MPNWCMNNIEIQGKEADIKAVKELIVGAGGMVDFDVLRPTPRELMGLVINDEKEHFTLNKVHPDRLGRFSGEDFLAEASIKLLDIDNRAGLIEDISKLTEEPYINLFINQEPIEIILENYVRSNTTQKSRRLFFGEDNIGVFMSKILEILQADHASNHGKSDSALSADCNTWRRQNWGTKWNAQDEHMECANEDSNTFFFSTAWTPPLYWFEELSEVISKLNLKVRMTLTYAEPDTDINGFLVREEDGDISQSRMTDDEVRRFLGIEEDQDCDGWIE